MVKYGLENTLLVNKCRLNECEMRMGLVTRLGKDSSRKYEHSTQRSSLNGFEDFPCVRQRDQCIFLDIPLRSGQDLPEPSFVLKVKQSNGAAFGNHLCRVELYSWST